jgi:isopentenyl-diphosphate delta-isomerase type 1
VNLLDEHVGRLDDAGAPCGTQLKSTVHHAHTPLHLAFSIFLFDDQGRNLFQQRAWHKIPWPGVWSNACCGHPLPGKSSTDATRRRLAYEMGITRPINLELALPDFPDRAQWGSIRENERCPVLIGHYDGPVRNNPTEVAATKWIDGDAFVSSRSSPAPTDSEANPYSPWSRREAVALQSESPILRQSAVA